MQKYTPPTYDKEGFHCPLCGILARQDWYYLGAIDKGNDLPRGRLNSDYSVAVCYNCKNVSFWFRKKIIYPLMSIAPLPNPDIPDEVKEDYDEARQIVAQSPRGAAALLRLAIQKLCKHLGEPGDNINTDIASLVSKGLGSDVQQALDFVRVVGNETVHPGEIDIRDDNELALGLFDCVNLIVTRMISSKKQVEALYAKLPKAKRDGIEKRDAKSGNKNP